MLWLSFGGVHGLAGSITPGDTVQSSIVGYLLGWGPLGIAAVGMAWLFSRGWRLISPAREAELRGEARADLIAERDRLQAEKHQAEEQRDAALKIAHEQVVPLLSSFVATTSALVPILQEIIRTAGGRRGGPVL